MSTPRPTSPLVCEPLAVFDRAPHAAARHGNATASPGLGSSLAMADAGNSRPSGCVNSGLASY